jgi:hypothetical protein
MVVRPADAVSFEGVNEYSVPTSFSTGPDARDGDAAVDPVLVVGPTL